MELAACGLAALLAHCILLQATVHIFKITELQIQFWMPTSGWKVRRPAPTLGLLLPDAQDEKHKLCVEKQKHHSAQQTGRCLAFHLET